MVLFGEDEQDFCSPFLQNTQNVVGFCGRRPVGDSWPASL